MKAPSRILLRTAVIGVLASSPSWAQQSPGLSAKPSGRSLAEPSAPPAEQSVDLTRPNPQAAIEETSEDNIYFAAAMQGQAWAQTKLGKLYTESPDDASRWTKGVDLLHQAADQNDTEALLALSRLAARGQAVPQSFVESFKFCSRAAQLGSPEAQNDLAGMYAGGRGIAKDMGAAISWGRKSAQAGYTPAKYALAMALLNAEDSSGSTSEAVSWLQSAAKDGHVEALFFLAGATAHGDYGLTKDETKAADMALPRAEAGDKEFQFALATLYLRGETFGNKREEGSLWLQRAADQGHEGAKSLLLEMKSPPP
jgi:TPR repeat protein